MRVTGIGDAEMLDELRRCIPQMAKEVPFGMPIIKVEERDPNGLSPSDPGAKLDRGKVMAGVLEDFALALLAVAEVGTFGANKYSRRGWERVPNGIERYNDAKWRHALKGRHESHDPDSKLLHASHEAWNALAKLELMLRSTP